MVELDRGLRGRAALSPDGRRVAVQDDDGGAASATGVVGRRRGTGRRAYASRAGRAGRRGWSAGATSRTWRSASYQEYVAVDLLTGDPERVLVLPEVRVDPGTVVAADALHGPGFSAAEPDRPVSPLLLLWLGVGAAATLVAALVLWRLRRLRRLRGLQGDA